MELRGQILLYTEPGCKECMSSKTKLESLLLPYTEIDLSLHPQRRYEMENLASTDSVPQIFFNGTHIGGYYDLIELESSGQLDGMIEAVKSTPAPDTAPRPPSNGAGETIGGGYPGVSLHRIRLEQLLIRMGSCGLLGAHRRLLTVHHYSFYGRELVEWLNKEESMPYQEAMETGGELVKEGLIVHTSDPSHPFVDAHELFKVVGAYHPSALNSGLTQSGFDLSAGKITENLRKCITSLHAKHVTEDGRRVNYEELKSDVEFAKYVMMSQMLQRVNPNLLSREEKMAFFINIYNSLMIHGIIARGAATNHLTRISFFKKVSYVIGGQNYSLNDIENGVLRGNRKGPIDLCRPFSSGDPRLSVSISDPDARIHFALNCGSKGCPPIRVYSADKLDSQLTRATKSFLMSGGCEVDGESRKVSLSAILNWYRVDFGRTEGEMLKWVCGYIGNTEKGRLLQELVDTKQFKIVWQSYDWGLNH